MRPLRLEFKGINSYSDRCEIDFEQLSRTGIFGFFGPTGSGKSTIFDAMMLALYGLVPRLESERSQNGAMNSSDRNAFVRLRFSVKGEEYFVERKYRSPKGSPLNLHESKVRLIKDNAVIAEKSRDVNPEIESLTGLSAKDFTMAVLLPQGKFEKFLLLKPADRNRLFTRLFHLERFAGEFKRKLDVAKDATEREIALLRERLSQLEDISQDDLAELQNDMKGIRSKADETEAELKDLSREIEKLADLSKLFSERTGLSKELSDLEDRQERIDEAKERLRKAEKAARLSDVLETYESDAKAAKNAHSELEKVRRDVANIEEDAKGARKALEKIEKPSLARIDELRNELAKYEANLGELKRRKKLLEQIERSEEQAALFDKKAREAHRRKLKALSAQTTSQKAVAELETKLKNLDKRASFCSEHEEAHKHYTRVKLLEEQLEEAQVRFREARRELEDYEQAARKTPEKMGISCELSEASERVSRHLKKLEEECTKLEEQLKALPHANAVKLADELTDSEPCPVCGSREHPAPAMPSEKVARLREDAEKAARECENASEMRQKLLMQLNDAAFAKKRFRAAEDGLNSLKDSIGEAQEKLKDLSGFSAKKFEAMWEDGREADALSKKVKDKLKEREQEAENAKDAVTEAKNEAENAERDAEHEREKAQDAQAEFGEVNSTIRKVFGEIDPATAIAAANREQKDLTDKLDELRDKSEELGEKLDRVKSKRDTLEGKCETLDSALSRSRKRLDMRLKEYGFSDARAAKESMLEDNERQKLKMDIEEYTERKKSVKDRLKTLDGKLENKQEPTAILEEKRNYQKKLVSAKEELHQKIGRLDREISSMKEVLEKGEKNREKLAKTLKKADRIEEIEKLTRGGALAQFVRRALICTICSPRPTNSCVISLTTATLSTTRRRAPTA
ncbi:MAG: SMC family ATPase [Planctomycetota bacterium]|nr:SMC family ATPase [Planctomycetota bacterium]